MAELPGKYVCIGLNNKVCNTAFVFNDKEAVVPRISLCELSPLPIYEVLPLENIANRCYFCRFKIATELP